MTVTPNYRGTLEMLFPNTALEDLAHFSREQLLDLVTSVEPQHSQHQDLHNAAPSVETHASTLSQEQPGLESLHSMPEQQLNEHNSTSTSVSIEQISDDVNALSHSALRPTSYLGVSSVQAALKVIALLHPEFESEFPLPTSRGESNRPSSSLFPSPPSQSFLRFTEAQILDAYFVNFQPFSPLLDEADFRRNHSAGLRKDDKWLALLNIVLALGTIAIAGADIHTHRLYFESSMGHLKLSSLGNPNLEVVQALGLIGGWYCHYISQPNLGYSLMGAALRMAITLGLHREPYNHTVPDPALIVHQEHKRRIWWSLSCLEIWGHETLGRLSIDCFGPSTTVNIPRQLKKVNPSLYFCYEQEFSSL
jgi:Fungal specific transcription factor domain